MTPISPSEAWRRLQAELVGLIDRYQQIYGFRHEGALDVEVFAERNPADLKVVKVTEANLTYVAIDGEGKPRSLPAG